MAATLTVHAYGNVDALHGIFNAVAMVMNSSSFEHMIRLAVVIGFAVLVVLVAFPGNLQKGWNWFIAVAVISAAMLVPKADVSIEDRTGAYSTVVVANVPWTLALLASVKSAIGVTLTEAFETAFQTIPTASRALPSQLSYLHNGMMFGARLVRASREAQPVSSYDQTDLTQFIRNCVVPELGRNISADAATRTQDLASAFAGTNPALETGYHDPGASWALKVDTCPNVWTALQTRLNAAGVAAVARAAASIMPSAFANNATGTIARLDAAIPAIYGKAALANASATASQIMVQNILINATADAAAVQASSNDPGLLLLASMRTQAVAQMNAGNLVQGRIAEEALPIIRNVTEGILYACFPLLCILLVASEARAMGALFKSYVYVLVWVEMWPPMFAIVNYLQTLEAAKAMAGAAYGGAAGSGLSIGTASQVYSTSVSALGTTAWMVTFVPVLAAAVVFGFDRIMSITGAMGGGIKGAQTEASAGTKGNLATGNVNFDKRDLASYESSPSLATTRSVGGSQDADTVNGQRVSNYASSRHLSSVNAMSAIGESVSTAAQAAQAATTRNQKGYESSIDAAYGAARAAMQGYSSTASKQLGYDVSTLGSSGVSATEVAEEGKRLAQQFGIQDSSAVSKQLGLALGGLPASLIGIKAGAGTTEQEMINKGFGVAVDSLTKRGLGRKQEIADSFKSSETFAEARRSNRDATTRVESSLREANGYRESIASDLSRTKQLTSDWQAFQRYAQTYQTDFGNLVEQEYQRRGWSVHDGVADPRRQEEVILSLFKQGAFRPDEKDGKRLFIPNSQGFGPSEAALQPALEVAAGGRDALASAHSAEAPGGGRAAVLTTAQNFDSRERQRERELGVAPTTGVDGSSTKAAVKQGQGSASAATRDAQAAIEKKHGEAQLDHDKRATQVSNSHRPILNSNPVTGDPIRNPALDGARSPATQVFPDAASDVRAQREREARAFAEQVAKVQIPTKPTK